MFYEHWSLVRAEDWHWSHFRPNELASRGDGSLLIDVNALNKLEHARDILGKPFIINSAFRDELYNAVIGGSPRSYHLEGRAFDISLRNHDKAKLIKILEQAGFTGLGINYQSFVHADNGTLRRW